MDYLFTHIIFYNGLIILRNSYVFTFKNNKNNKYLVEILNINNHFVFMMNIQSVQKVALHKTTRKNYTIISV